MSHVIFCGKSLKRSFENSLVMFVIWTVLLKIYPQGQRNGSTVMSTFYFYKGSRFGFQNSHGSLQPPVCPVPEDLALILASLGTRHTYGTHTYIHVGKTHVHNTKANLGLEKWFSK